MRTEVVAKFLYQGNFNISYVMVGIKPAAISLWDWRYSRAVKIPESDTLKTEPHCSMNLFEKTDKLVVDVSQPSLRGYWIDKELQLREIKFAGLDTASS